MSAKKILLNKLVVLGTVSRYTCTCPNPNCKATIYLDKQVIVAQQELNCYKCGDHYKISSYNITNYAPFMSIEEVSFLKGKD